MLIGGRWEVRWWVVGGGWWVVVGGETTIFCSDGSDFNKDLFIGQSKLIVYDDGMI